jgi:nitronate monooxygenase
MDAGSPAKPRPRFRLRADGTFLDCDRNRAVALQIATLALVPQVADAVSVPVIAAGGVADGRGIAAAFALGASGAQIGTGCLLFPEAATPALHRDALRHAHEHATVVTNVFTGRPARAFVNRLACEIGFLTGVAPDFPLPMVSWRRCAARENGRAVAISHRSCRVRRPR